MKKYVTERSELLNREEGENLSIDLDPNSVLGFGSWITGE